MMIGKRRRLLNYLKRTDVDGYRRADLRMAGQPVTVLTPESIVRMFAQGFVPQVHESIGDSAG